MRHVPLQQHGNALKGWVIVALECTQTNSNLCIGLCLLAQRPVASGAVFVEGLTERCLEQPNNMPVKMFADDVPCSELGRNFIHGGPRTVSIAEQHVHAGHHHQPLC
jgi:hypothetical protein